MYATCAKIGSAYAPPGEILKLDISTLTPIFLKDCNDRVFKQYEKLAEKYKTNGERDHDALAKGQGAHLLKAITAELKRRFNPKRKSDRTAPNETSRRLGSWPQPPSEILIFGQKTRGPDGTFAKVRRDKPGA
jgi:hypothetical protein